MKRRLLTLCSALSLLLCVAVCLLWVRSYWTTDEWFLIYRAAGGSEYIRSCRGQFVFRHTLPDGQEPHGGVERVSHRAVRTDTLPPGFGGSPDDRPAHRAGRAWPLQRRWGPVRWDFRPAAQPLDAYHRDERAARQDAEARLAVLRQNEHGPDPTYGPSIKAQIRTVEGRLNQRHFLAPPEGPRWQLTVPAWALAAASALLPGVWFLVPHLRRRRRRRAGLCVACGYDLRASPERCPECGAAARSELSTNPGASQ